MTQPKSPILDYRKPSGGSPSLHRPKAVRNALATGVVCLVMFLFLGTLGMVPPETVRHLPNPRNAIWTLGVMWLNAFSYLFCGTLYIVASRKIRCPNRSWERTFVIVSGAHIAVVILGLTVNYFLFDARNRNLQAASLFTFAVSILMFFLLAYLFLLACYTRWRCG